jgi:hypothetical protein
MLGRDAHDDARSTREVVDFALFLAVVTDSFSVEFHRCFTPFQHEPMDPFDAPISSFTPVFGFAQKDAQFRRGVYFKFRASSLSTAIVSVKIQFVVFLFSFTISVFVP